MSQKKEANGLNIGRDNSYEICHEKRGKSLSIGRMKFVTKKEANGPSIGIGRDDIYVICHKKRGKWSQYRKE